MNPILLVFIGGGLGCVVRFLIGKISANIFESNFPISTLIANIFSCLIMGLLVFFYKKNSGFESVLKPLIIIGFCGGLSTFSTFSFETIGLVKSDLWGMAILNVVLSVFVCFLVLYYLVK